MEATVGGAVCLSLALLIVVGRCPCGAGGPDLKAEAVAYRMHHQQGNMRGPHHPRSSEAAVHHGKTHRHHQLQRPEGEGEPVPKLTQDTSLLRDEEHIREDLENLLPGEDTKKMSPEELEFYYFKLHDFDNNTKLDGLEILQAIQHVMHSGDDLLEHGAEGGVELRSQSDGSVGDEVKTTSRSDFIEEAERLDDDFSYFVELIDKVLEEDDLDHDGFLSYIEYVQGRKKDQIKREKKNKRI